MANCHGSGSVGLIIHVNTAEPNMTVSSSPNCNLQTGSAQQQGKRVREGGFFVCLQIRNNASLFSSKFYFWLSHKFECTCDRFWAKWEFCNFSIFLWFSDSVGLWWISRSHDMYRVQKWSQQQLKMHSNNCCTCITRYWVWLLGVAPIWRYVCSWQWMVEELLEVFVNMINHVNTVFQWSASL